MSKNLIETCYKKSVELLLDNSSRFGVRAAAVTDPATRKHYIDIFGRDGGICVLGMVASRNEKLLTLAGATLETLARYQTKRGQIPNSVLPEKDEVSFYHLGCIDATLWWLIALDFYDRYAGDTALKAGLAKNIKQALKWLGYQDTNNDRLLEQGESCDWADDMPVIGIVLYTNALWYYVTQRYNKLETGRIVKDGLNNLFLPHLANPNKSAYLRQGRHPRKHCAAIRQTVENFPYYLHYTSYRHASDRCDVYGNLLAILFGVAGEARADSIIRYLRNHKVSKYHPVQVLFPPIEPDDFEWLPYLKEERSSNKPYGYHNGGIWPYVGGFWVMALRKTGHEQLAVRELEKLARANAVNDWEFNEWFNGKTGQPMGMVGQSWNAGMFLLAYHYLKGGVEI